MPHLMLPCFIKLLVWCTACGDMWGLWIWCINLCVVWPCLCSVVEIATIFLSSGFAGLQTCSSAACSASGATSLGLRIFRNNWTDSLPIITNDMQLVDSKGWSKSSRDSECFDSFGERVQLLWTGTRLPGSIVQQRKLSMLAEFTCWYCWVNMCSKVSPIDPVISSSPFFFGSMGKGVTLKSYHQWLDSDVSEVSGATLEKSWRVLQTPGKTLELGPLSQNGTAHLPPLQHPLSTAHNMRKLQLHSSPFHLRG